MISFTSKSSDGNVLGGTTNLVGLSYTPRAICIQSGGNTITSGSDSVAGKEVFVIMQPVEFDADLGSVQSWFAAHSPYLDQFMAQIIGNDATQSYTTVSTAGTASSAPKIVITSTGSNQAALSLANASTNTLYRVESAPSLNPPISWTIMATMTSTDSIPVSVGPSNAFYRVETQ